MRVRVGRGEESATAISEMHIQKAATESPALLSSLGNHAQLMAAAAAQMANMEHHLSVSAIWLPER